MVHATRYEWQSPLESAAYFEQSHHRGWLLAAAWRELYLAQRAGRLARSGPYSRVRHPQYIGFVLIMFGFLLQWPTLLTLVMFPVLVIMYARLAKHEETWAKAEFKSEWDAYAKEVPAFFPMKKVRAH